MKTATWPTVITAPASPPHIAAIILNNRRPSDTLACLASLSATGYPRLATIVLNLGSGPALNTEISQRFPDVEVITLNDNGGYAGNNNLGLRLGLERGAAWLLLLNDDTYVDRACLDHLVRWGETDTHIGLVGPTVYQASEPQVIQSAGGQIDGRWRSSLLAQNEADKGQLGLCARHVDWLSGCALMVRREFIEAIGLLDDRFFLYWEETEWCLRARRQGWHVLHVPQAKVWHKGAQHHDEPSPDMTYYSARNRWLVFMLHQAPLLVRLGALVEYGRTLLAWSLRPQWRHLRAHRDALWQALWHAALRRWGSRQRAA